MNLRQVYSYLKESKIFEGVGVQTSAVSGEKMRDTASNNSLKHMYKFGDFYPSNENPTGIVVIEEGQDGHPLTIMSLTSFNANGDVCYDEQRLTWDEAMKGASKYNPDGHSAGQWELPSKEQFEVAFSVSESGENEESIRKIEFINKRIDDLNNGRL